VEDYGLTSFSGVGGVFAISVTTMLIGVVRMVVPNARSPSFLQRRDVHPASGPGGRHGAQLARDDA
jgi:hypothetical protein